MTKTELKTIKVDKILANFYQPRTKFDREKIKELAESILSNGLINPITVTPDKKRKGKFMIVSGERRWQAHKIAGLKTIRAFVKEYKNPIQFKIESLIENIHRENLTSMETAKFIKEIWIDMGKPPHQSLALKLGVHQVVVSEYLSLVDDKTPKEVKKAVEKGKLAMRSASMIRQLPEKEQIEIAKEAMRRERGMGRTEIKKETEKRKIKNEYGIESLKLERTEQDIVNDILSDLSSFKEHFKEMKKRGFDMFKTTSLERIATSIIVSLSFIVELYKFGITPDKRFLELVKRYKNGEISK
ncbi:MAG: ParB/RepB/Spo0J family partition protein [Candidatus Heimdallarchaeaceae archaeon]